MKTPLLFVDVNLGNGQQERIVVCEGDNVNDLANNFSEIHSKIFKIVLNEKIYLQR